MSQNKSHMTLNNRLLIQKGIVNGSSFKAIAKEINKSCTTISREIRNHIVKEKTGCHGRYFNNCKNRINCKITKEKVLCKKLCSKRHCVDCIDLCLTTKCKDYTPVVCKKLLKAPYVCNGCTKENRCTLEKSYYDAIRANKEYKENLKTTRNGFSIDEDDRQRIGSLLKDGFNKGQSLSHIINVYGEDNIGYSLKTLYTYVDAGVFEDVGNLDMPRKVRYKNRKKPQVHGIRKDSSCRIGRTYTDYKEFISKYPDVVPVEMDTVIGKIGINEKVLLTLHWKPLKFQLAFLLDHKTSDDVTKVFTYLKDELGYETFSKLFNVILTDNGTEFSNPLAIEEDVAGVILTSVYYCDPRASQQKGSCENNHEFIRRIIPKGQSMSSLTQDDVNLMMSHINSYTRTALNGKSAFDMFKFVYGSEVIKKLGLKPIDPAKITLKPSLFNLKA